MIFLADNSIYKKKAPYIELARKDIMEAIEFVVRIKRGKLIEIPEEYKKDVSGEIRVIILMIKKEKQEKRLKEVSKALRIKTKGFRFNRQEIYKDR